MLTEPRPILLLALHAAGGTCVVSVCGDLDASAAAELADVLERIAESEPERVVFDLSQAGFLDCFAAGAILSAVWSLRAGRLVIRFPSPAVLRLLEITGLDAHCVLEAHPVAA